MGYTSAEHDMELELVSSKAKTQRKGVRRWRLTVTIGAFMTFVLLWTFVGLLL